MNGGLHRSLIAAATLTMALAGAPPAAAGPPDGDAPAASVLVKLRPGVAQARRALPGRALPGGWLVVAVSDGETIDEALARWSADPAVEAVEPNATISAAPLPVAAAAASPQPGADPLAYAQWHMDAVQAAAARRVASGEGVVVAVLDTGVTRGSDLACRRLVAEYDARRNRSGPGAAADDHGHGTHVAGTIAQCTGNDIGVAGMAPAVTLMPVKVLDAEGNGDYASLAAAIDWAAGHGADVINLSLGGPCTRPWPACRSVLVDEAIARATDAGAVIVAASGNRGGTAVDYPANHPAVIAVGATTRAGRVAPYSNGGPGIDLAAPGGRSGAAGTSHGVLQESFWSGMWGYWERAGTSFAAPHVSGAAALVRSIAPDASPATVRAALTCTAAEAGAAGYDHETGHGSLQAAAALAAVSSGMVDRRPPEWPAGAVLEAVFAGGGVVLSWTAAHDCDRVAAYRVRRDGLVIGTVGGGRTSFETAGSGAYSVEAVDPAGNAAPGPEAVVTPPPVVDPEDGGGDGWGLVDAVNGIWHLRHGGAAVSFYYGNPGDVPFAGDWDCDGVDTPGLYRRSSGYVYLRNSNTPGTADITYHFGNPGDVPLAGDFDGDGCDTVSLYRPSAARVYVVNRLGHGAGGLGAADLTFAFGDAGDVPFVLDADGNGADEVAVHRPSSGEVFVRNRLAAGPADARISFGRAGDIVIGGDWDGDGKGEPAARRPGDRSFHLADGRSEQWGDAHWLPISGRFWG